MYQGLDMDSSFSHLGLSYTSRSILQSVSTALEELELHVHNATVKSDHAHMYLCILREQQLYDLVPFSRYVIFK